MEFTPVVNAGGRRVWGAQSLKDRDASEPAVSFKVLSDEGIPALMHPCTSGARVRIQNFFCQRKNIFFKLERLIQNSEENMML